MKRNNNLKKLELENSSLQYSGFLKLLKTAHHYQKLVSYLTWGGFVVSVIFLLAKVCTDKLLFQRPIWLAAPNREASNWRLSLALT